MSFLIKIDERRARFCGLMDIGTQTSPSKGGNKSEGKIVSRIISANKVDVEFARNRPSTSGRDERAINPCSPRAQDTHNTPRIVLSFKIVTWKKKNFFFHICNNNKSYETSFSDRIKSIGSYKLPFCIILESLSRANKP